MCATEKMVVVHKWEDKGVGKAPFRLVGFISMPNLESFGTNVEGYNNAMIEAWHVARSHGVRLGSCDVCGTGIHNHYVIQEAGGKRFVVGCDCVAKTDDSKLITAVENDRRVRDRAKRRAASEVKYAAERQRRIDAEQTERSANGGKTLREIDEESRQAALIVAREKYQKENWWLIHIIQGMSGEFIQSMTDKLCEGPISGLSDRCVSILRDIYGKAHGRSNSKKYDAAVEVFNSYLPESVE